MGELIEPLNKSEELGSDQIDHVSSQYGGLDLFANCISLFVAKTGLQSHGCISMTSQGQCIRNFTSWVV
jgi:hypothetical protein